MSRIIQKMSFYYVQLTEKILPNANGASVWVTAQPYPKGYGLVYQMGNTTDPIIPYYPYYPILSHIC